MQLIDLNMQDGRGLMTVAVSDCVDGARLREYFKWAENLANEFNYQREKFEDLLRLNAEHQHDEKDEKRTEMAAEKRLEFDAEMRADAFGA